jgi:hypothetical protein
LDVPPRYYKRSLPNGDKMEIRNENGNVIGLKLAFKSQFPTLKSANMKFLQYIEHGEIVLVKHKETYAYLRVSINRSFDNTETFSIEIFKKFEDDYEN